mgnify:CR=1 FL=1
MSYTLNVMKKLKNKNHMRTIKKIENIRKKNNINWMNLLRLAFKYSPKQTAEIMSKIYIDDSKISKLVKKLSK